MGKDRIDDKKGEIECCWMVFSIEATWLSATMNPFLPCSFVVGDAPSSTPLQPTPPSDSHAFSGLNDLHFTYTMLSRDLGIAEVRCYPTIDSSSSVWVSGI